MSLGHYHRHQRKLVPAALHREIDARLSRTSSGAFLVRTLFFSRIGREPIQGHGIPSAIDRTSRRVFLLQAGFCGLQASLAGIRQARRLSIGYLLYHLQRDVLDACDQVHSRDNARRTTLILHRQDPILDQARLRG